MSPLTAGFLILMGASVAAFVTRGDGAASPAAAYGAAFTAASASVILIGYLYGQPLFYGGLVIPVAAAAAGCLFVLSASLLADAGRGLWPWSVFEGDSARALMLRSFLPLSVGIILVMGTVEVRLDHSQSVLHSALLLLVALLLTALLVNRLSARVGAFIEAAEARCRRVIETTQEGFCEVDLSGRVVSVNPRMEQLFGYVPGEMLGLRLIDDLYFPEDRAKLLERLATRAQGRSDSFEQRYRTKSGEPVWMMVSATPIMSADGVHGGSFAMMTDITARRTSAAELERLRTAVEQTGESLFITDREGAIQYVNPAFETATGYSRREVMGKTPRILKSGNHDEGFYRELWGTISSGRVWKGRMINKRKDGSLITEDSTISPVRGADGLITHYAGIKRDVTDYVRLEEQLRHAQQMESVGRLAGGVAHDFNNILTAITGYANFAVAGLPQGDHRRDDLEQVLAAAGRAARLTSQLLAFSRKQVLRPEILDLNAGVRGIVNMLERLLGEHISLETRLASRPCLVEADAGQLEQVFLNLAVNARDAMPKGGTLSFETRIEAVAGVPLVCLSVRDTGAGMDDEVKTRLFEPFFTTKERGKGTGLGLSMVYGIIKQSGGDIAVESSPGCGTTFRIYLPHKDARAPSKDKDEAQDGRPAPRGSETVLLVEDEDAIRRLGERALTSQGYTVLSAPDGREALKVLERHGRAVDLLITDVVMPGMSGRELAREIAKRGMAHRILFGSGYTEDAIAQDGVLEPGLAFLYKPFSPDSLVRKARAVLDGPADQAAA